MTAMGPLSMPKKNEGNIRYESGCVMMMHVVNSDAMLFDLSVGVCIFENFRTERNKSKEKLFS